jgi:mono/diheme cytochrome c family protein
VVKRKRMLLLVILVLCVGGTVVRRLVSVSVEPAGGVVASQPATSDQGPATRDQRPGTSDQGPATRDQGPVSPAGDEPPLGRRVYARCQACHGLQGEGVAGNYPPLAGSAVLAGEQAITLVLRGAPRGSQWNGQMPAFAEQLSDEEIAAVLTWTRQQWSVHARPVTAANIAALRP